MLDGPLTPDVFTVVFLKFHHSARRYIHWQATADTQARRYNMLWISKAHNRRIGSRLTQQRKGPTNMNNIQGINPYTGPQAVGPQPAKESGPSNTPAQRNSGADKVEISQIANLLSRTAMLPDIRADKVQNVRKALQQGTYDLPAKLPVALDRLLDEHQFG